VIAEAVDTVLTLGWALAGWIAVGALAAALALHTLLAVVWWAGRWAWRACRSAWSAMRAPERGSRDSRDAGDAPKPAERRTAPRPTPPWAHTDHHYEEAA
jgi:hypothetical protein